jgi:hypothetical protein
MPLHCHWVWWDGVGGGCVAGVVGGEAVAWADITTAARSNNNQENPDNGECMSGQSGARSPVVQERAQREKRLRLGARSVVGPVLCDFSPGITQAERSGS